MAKSKKEKAKKASKALLTAVQQGDVATVKKCLAKGESPDADTGYGTPMIWVRGLGDNTGVVRALLEADPDEHSEEGDCSKDGYTPSKKTSWITFTDIDDWSDSVSIGGEPEWAQHDDWVDCPSCKKRRSSSRSSGSSGSPRGRRARGTTCSSSRARRAGGRCSSGR